MVRCIMISFIISILCGCIDNRWPKSDLDFNKLAISDSRMGEHFQISITIPSISVNSYKWPFVNLIESGDGVIVIECLSDGADIIQSNIKASRFIAVKGNIGDRIIILLRDESDGIQYISTYVLTGKDAFVGLGVVK